MSKGRGVQIVRGRNVHWGEVSSNPVKWPITFTDTFNFTENFQEEEKDLMPVILEHEGTRSQGDTP